MSVTAATRTLCILNFGCKVNQAENVWFEEEARKRGVRVTTDSAAATDILINTCAVTARAESQVRQLVRRVGREHPTARVFLTGCYVDRDGTRLGSLPGVTEVFRNADKERIVSAVLPRLPMAPAAFVSTRTRPLLKIQDGCNLHCAFCIIPELRGRTIRSMPPDEVVRRVTAYRAAGYPEVIMTGVLLGAYGSDLTPRIDLADLLTRLEPHAPKLRISSVEPWRLSDRIVTCLGSADFIQPHFHIPIQSGSASVLQRMNRRLDLGRLDGLMRKLRSMNPDVSVGSDVIVGFPGETEAEFEETVDAVKRLEFSYLHVFPYSPRPGTPAAGDANQVRREVIRRRAALLREISATENLAFRRRFEGREIDGVILGKGDDEGAQAITGNYIKVTLETNQPTGAARILITQAGTDATHGRIVT